MELTPSSAALIGEALHKITELYSGEEDQLLSTDFYFQPLQEEGGLLVFNDNDEEIAHISIPEWQDYATETFYEEITTQLAAAIEAANTDGELERLAVWMPYSFVLVDEDKEAIVDLLIIDDDTLILSTDLLEGFDEEMNSFLKKLLEE